MTRLSIHVADQVGADRPIEVSPFVVGRDPECDLVLDDPRASRRHAQVEVQPDGRVVLRDLGSETGTFVDGARIDGGVWFAVPGSFRVGRTVLGVRQTKAADVAGDATAPAVVAAAAATAAAPAPAPAPAVPYATPAVGAAAVVATAAPAPAPAVLWAPVSDTAAGAAPPGFRSSRTRSLVAIVAIALAGVLDAVNLVHRATFDRLADDLTTGAAGVTEAAAYDATTLSIASVSLLTLIVAWISYLAWISRAVENAPALGAGTPPHSPRGAIGWWFVPIANFFVPYQIVSDLHDRLATAPAADRARLLLLGWWLTWTGGNIIGTAASYLGGDTIETLRSQVTIWMVSDALNMVAAVLAILVVRRIVDRETARAAPQPA